jgi:glycosyltransferase 2 family protein
MRTAVTRTRLGGVLRRVVAIVTSLPGRLIISVLLLAAVARSIDWSALDESLSGAAWGWFAAGTAVVCLALLTGAVRWHALLHHANLPARPGETLRAYWIGIFSNNFLPTGFGGDVVRAWVVARSGKPLARAFTSVLVDRSVALLSLVLLGWIGIAFATVDVPGKLITPFAVVTVAGAVLGLGAIALLRRRGLSRFLPAVMRPLASEVAATLRNYGRDRGVQVEALLLSLGFQALMVTSMWMLSQALQLDLSPVVLAVVMPLVLIATLVPISVAGFGVREGAYVLLLGELGVSASDATLLSLFSVAALAVASLPGALAIALGRQGAGIAHLATMPSEPRITADPAAPRQ